MLQKTLIIFLLLSNITFASETYIFPSEISEDDNSALTTEDNQDPYESFNRKIFKFNHYLEEGILKPVATIYIRLFPKWFQHRVSDFVDNLSIPISFVNHLISTDIKSSIQDFWRFGINATFGMGGLYDFASSAGFKSTKYGFNDTLIHYNILSGPYLVLPLFGPSTGRNAIGLLGDSLMDPFNYFSKDFTKVKTGLVFLDRYTNKIKFIDRIENSSLDPYITIRTMYLQNNASKTNN